MIGKELVGHAVSNRHGNLPGTLFYQPPLYFLARAAPWSLFAWWGFWRVWNKPAGNTLERRFERFLFSWFFTGLFIFCMAPQQRGDHLWPILPAGALLAGRELSRLTARFRPMFVQAGTAVLAALFVAGFAFYYFGPNARSLNVEQTVALQQLARQAEAEFGREFPLTQVGGWIKLQMHLNTLRPTVACEQGAALLRGPEPALLAVDDLEKMEAARQAGDPPFFILLPRPGTPNRSPICIIANRRTWSPTNAFAFYFGPLLVRASGAQLLGATERGFCFKDLQGPGWISFTNESPQPRTVRLRIEDREHPLEQERLLRGNDSWQIACNADGAK
jgi:hypothetical protein